MNTLNIGSPWLFSEGLAAVHVKNRWGFIDKNGNINTVLSTDRGAWLLSLSLNGWVHSATV